MTIELIETLVSVPDERQSGFLSGARRLEASLCLGGAHGSHGGSVRHVFEIISWKVRSIGHALQLGLERCDDIAEGVPIDPVEERVTFYLLGSVASKTLIRRSDQGSDEIFRFWRKVDFLWEVETLLPVDDFAICFMRFLGTEWRPSYEALEHNSSKGPPIALLSVSLVDEYFRRNVVGSTNGGIGHNTTGLTPRVDLIPVRNRQVDSVDHNAIPIPWRGRSLGLLQQLLVVRLVVGFMETR